MSDGVRVGSIFMELGLDIDQVKLNDVVQSIGKLNLNSVLATLGVATLVDGLKNIMDTASAMTESMYKFSTVTHLSGEKMQQWSEYAQRMGASADFVKNTLSDLQLSYGKFLTGNADAGQIKAFMAINQVLNKLKMPVLNESDLKDPYSMLQKITIAMQEIQKNNPSLARNVLSWAHLSDELLLIKSFKSADNIPVPNQEQVVKIRQYNAAWTATGQILQLIFTDIASDYAPALTELANNITKVEMSLHKMGISLRDVIDFILGVVALNTPLGRLVYLLYMIVTHMKEIKSFSEGAGHHISKIVKEFSPSESTLNQLKGFNLENIKELLNPSGLFSLIGNAVSGASSQVTHTNTFNIVAHGIEDFEHKIVAVLEKAISNSYRQNVSQR